MTSTRSWTVSVTASQPLKHLLVTLALHALNWTFRHYDRAAMNYGSGFQSSEALGRTTLQEEADRLVVR